MRNRKISPQKLISFLVSQGSSSTKVEMLDFWGLDTSIPSSSARNQQRAKLKPDALEAVFKQFNSSVQNLPSSIFSDDKYRFLAADGSTCTYFSTPNFSSGDYYCSPGNSIRCVYSMHLNAFFDLETHTYTDALIQSVHNKNEFCAFCDLVDRHEILDGRKNIYIGDRGYCSYNNRAHVLEQEQYFLFRTKDIHSKGLVGNFDFPDTESFDMDVRVTLVRSHSKKVSANQEGYLRFVDQAASFDYIEYESYDTYECIVTNLTREEFPTERIKVLYKARGGIESSFRKLKYTIGLSNFHAYKPEYIKQDWQFLLEYYLWKYGKPVKPIQWRNGKSIPEDTVFPLCGTPHHYLYDNNGQYQCKICGQTFVTGEVVTSPVRFVCPYCGHSLVPKKDRTFFRLHKCVNPKCSFYLHNLSKVDPERLGEDYGKNKYKLHYLYREFTVDFFRMDLNSLPKNTSSLKFCKHNAHIMSLCLTIHVNL